MSNEPLYTHYQIELKNIPLDWEIAICDSLKGVNKILQFVDIYLDDDTPTEPGEERQVIITGIGMTRSAYKQWKEEYLPK